MKKSFFVSALFLFACLISCKKSSTPAPSNATGSSGHTSTYGVLKCERTYFYSKPLDSLFFFSNNAIAYFSTNPNFSTMVAVTSVFTDTTRLKYETISQLYDDTTYHLKFNSSVIWKVIGLNTIPSFTVTNNDSMPSYTGASALPDTIDRSQNLVLSLTGLTNNSDVTAQLASGSQMIMQANLSGGNCTITIPTNTLTTLPAGYATLSIISNKYQDQTISNKGFLFVKSNIVQKSVTLK